MTRIQPYVYPQLTPAPHSLGLFGFVPTPPERIAKSLGAAETTVDGIKFYRTTYHFASACVSYAKFSSNVELDLYTIEGKQS